MKKIETLEFLEEERQRMRLYEIIALALLYILIALENILFDIDSIVSYTISAVCLVATIIFLILYSISRHVTKNSIKNNPQFKSALNNEMYQQYKLRAYRNGAITFMTAAGLFYIFANHLPVTPRFICVTILFAGGLAITISEYVLYRR